MSRADLIQRQLEQLYGGEMSYADRVRADALEERSYSTEQEMRRAQLAAQRAQELRAQGVSDADIAQITRAEQERDRMYELEHSSAGANLDLNRAGALGGLDMNRYGIESGLRGEMRDERDYQNALSIQANRDRVEQARLEDDFATSKLIRDIAYANANNGLSGNDQLIAAPPAIAAALHFIRCLQW
jgi:hypothetical protein